MQSDTHLSGVNSARKFSTDIRICLSWEIPSCFKLLMRSSAPFKPAENPTGCGAMLLDWTAIPWTIALPKTDWKASLTADILSSLPDATMTFMSPPVSVKNYNFRSKVTEYVSCI